MNPVQPVLVLFCKEPRLGHGKQRLAATIGKERALRIACALLDCALEDAAHWNGTFVISPASDAEVAWAETLIGRAAFRGRHTQVMAQNAGNLGKRLTEIDSRLRTQGVTQIVYMGNDAPLLNSEHYSAVTTALDVADVVLADGTDGGVTLMASGCGWPDLEALPWSTEYLGDALAASCRATGRNVHRLDGSFDIDDENDARRLIEYLDGDQRPSRQALHKVLREEFCVTA